MPDQPSLSAAAEVNFEGMGGPNEHRTVGPHRAWCHGCSEWCYPDDYCRCCKAAKMTPSFSLPAVMQTLIRRNVITVDPARAYECCGIPRDEDGFCAYKPRHPIYVDVTGRLLLPAVSARPDEESER